MKQDIVITSSSVSRPRNLLALKKINSAVEDFDKRCGNSHSAVASTSRNPVDLNSSIEILEGCFSEVRPMGERGAVKRPSASISKDPRKRVRVAHSSKKVVSTTAFLPIITSTPSRQTELVADISALPSELQQVMKVLPCEERVQAIMKRDAVVDMLFSKVKGNLDEYNDFFSQERNRILGEIASLESSITLFQEQIREKKAQLDNDQVYMDYTNQIKAFISSK